MSPAPAAVPDAVYRIELRGPTGTSTFAHARALVPYLESLGIGHVYSPPVLRARSGSAHGYDVVDATEVDPALGGAEGLRRLAGALHDRGMGLVLDIVPNHMAASSENPWWRDVLEHGPASAYARYFDIDWSPSCSRLNGRVLLPVLGDRRERVLERGELSLTLDAGGLGVRYHEHRFPLDPATYDAVLGDRLADLSADTGADSTPVRRLRALLDRIRSLPARSPALAASRGRAGDVVKAELRRLRESEPAVRDFLDANVQRLNRRAESRSGAGPAAAGGLERLLRRQAYDLAFWRRAAREVNYRRFFDISDLVGMRVEAPDVFAAMHERVIRLAREGVVDGLRVDHIDGLRTPGAYLRSLERLLRGRAARTATDRTGAAPTYIVVEKILARGEALPDDWPVAGTTGYEFMNAVNDLFVDPYGLPALRRSYATITGRRETFADVAYRARKQVIDELFGVELCELAHDLGRLADRAGAEPVPEPAALARALVEIAACMPVYRTYFCDRGVDDRRCGARDREWLERALDEARRRSPDADSAAHDLARRALLLCPGSEGDRPARPANVDFVLRWQQFTGAVMAKGVEDTALYVRTPLASRNEVGGHPGRAPQTLRAFHRAWRERQARRPGGVNATATHDAKRGEDVRARLNVLSEEPARWERRLRRWMKWNAPRKPRIDGRDVPDAAGEILLYQTLLGAWPLDEGAVDGFRDRLDGYLVKAAREAKRHTRWTRPDERWEGALLAFAERILDGSDDNPFPADFLRCQRRIAFYGAFNSLGQTLLKVAAPGVPDVYRGTELWDFSLVDPDNRRPVDYDRRRRLLAELDRRAANGRAALAEELLDSWPDGRIKMYALCTALRFRREHARLFRAGSYIPIAVEGRLRRHVCAFARQLDGAWVIAAAPRFLTAITTPDRPPIGSAAWTDGRLLLPDDAPAAWTDRFTGARIRAVGPGAGRAGIPLADTFRRFPVALLTAC